MWQKFFRTSSLETPSGCQNGALSDPRGFQNRPKSLPGPLWGAGGAEGEKGPRPEEKITSRLTFQTALGAPRPHFGPQVVPRNAPKSTWRGSLGTPGRQDAPKIFPKGGPKMGSKKRSKRGPKMKAFWMLKTCKSTIR